jgi:hypothetical protein
MRKIIISSAFFLFVHCTFTIDNCEAQWVQMSNGIGDSIMVYSSASSGVNILVGIEFNGVYKSTDNGSNWTQTSINNQAVFSFATSINKVFAGTNHNGVYLSTNNGTSWIQTSLNNRIVVSLAIKGNNIFAGTNANGLYISNDNGTTWTQTLNGNIFNVLVINGNDIFAGINNWGVNISTDNGSSWIQTSLNNQIVASISINGNKIFVGTCYNGVFLSTNNGTSWTQTTLNNQYIYSLAVNGNNVFAGSYKNGVYVSNDNGTNWSQRNDGLGGDKTVNTLLISNGYLFASVYYWGIYRRPLSELIGIEPISSEIPKTFSLSQNYPNPFNPSTKIKLDIPSSVKGEMSNIQIVIYDILGKEIAIIVNEQLKPGSYEVEWDGSNYSSGVYYYTLQSESFKETKRMVLVK